MSIESKLKRRYGLSIQLSVWIEELLELSLELQRLKKNIDINGVSTIYNDLQIIEEIADVEFCMDQMKAYFDNEEIQKVKAEKINRTKQRFLK